MYKNRLTALVIAYTFPPANGTSWRCFHLYRTLLHHFDQVKVISTTNNSKSNSNIPEIETNENIHRVATLDYRTIRLRKTAGQVAMKESNKSNLKFKIYNLLNSFPFNIIVGEGGLIYIMNGFFTALNNTPSDGPVFLISSFRPYADHIIGYLLKLFRNNIFWVADFRDLHIDPRLNETYFPKIQKWFNRKILSKADIVTTVSKGLSQHLTPFHHNTVVLRNGIGIMAQLAEPKKAMTKFTITYTGSMFRDLRKPDLLLEALSSLVVEQKIEATKIQLLYAGKDTSTWLPLLAKYNIGGLFKSLGSITHEEAMNLQASAHINLLLTYASPELKGNATGKLYEYLAAQRPILLLINGCEDEELEEIFEETGAGLVAYESLNHKELVKQFVLSKYNEWLETGKVCLSISSEKLETYRWDYMMKEFLDRYYFKTLPEGA